MSLLAQSQQLHRMLLPMGVLAAALAAVEARARVSWGLAWKLGLFAGGPWLMWWLMLRVMRSMTGGSYHPPVGDEPLLRSRRVLCVSMLIVLAVILTPIPLRVSL